MVDVPEGCRKTEAEECQRGGIRSLRLAGLCRHSAFHFQLYGLQVGELFWLSQPIGNDLCR